MGFIDKFLESMRLTPDDDDDDPGYIDGDDIDEIGYGERNNGKRGKSRKSDDDLYEKDEPASSKPKFSPRSRKVVPIPTSGRNMEVCSIKPTTYDDAKEICDTLLSGRAVILNLEGLHIEIAQRIIDFTFGACYAMDGNLQKVSNYILVITPANVELSGDFQDIVGEAGNDLNLNIHL